jgi:hypothetical protein
MMWAKDKVVGGYNKVLHTHPSQSDPDPNPFTVNSFTHACLPFAPRKSHSALLPPSGFSLRPCRTVTNVQGEMRTNQGRITPSRTRTEPNRTPRYFGRFRISYMANAC